MAPHEQEIPGTLRQAPKMAEDPFFRVLARATQQAELNNDKDPRAPACSLTTMMQGTIVMIKARRGGQIELIHADIPRYDYLPVK
jgi:hypothetical protein